MIYFEVEAGLCNRLRGIVAAYNYAKEYEQKLTVIWEQNVNCNMKFKDIFLVEVDIPCKIKDFNAMGQGVKYKIIHGINKFRIQCMKMKSGIVMMQTVDVEQLQKRRMPKNMYISTCYQWYGENNFQIFKLKPQIEEKISLLEQMCGKNCVGVHIRRTDHVRCMEESPTDKFIEKMKEESADTVFFVATDDAEERTNLINIFGQNRILYQKDAELSRKSENGMEHAVIDLFMLSRTKKILGSSGSSFSEVAGLLGNTEVIYCK